MAKWRMRLIKCPRCKDDKREPVDLAQAPRLHFRSMAGEINNQYAQQCHLCTSAGASPALQKVYDQAWERIVAIARQHEKEEAQC